MNFSKSYLDFTYYKFPELENKFFDKKNLVILPSDNINAKEDELINSILKAIKLEQQDFYRLQLHQKEPTPLALSKGYENVVYILVFGLEPKQLGMSFTKKPVVNIGSKTFFFAPHPGDLLRNKSEKVILWNNLKQYFL